jgi:hypothetical protein
MEAVAHEGLHEVLRPLLPSYDAQQLAWKWSCGDEAATREVEEALRRRGLTIEAVMAQTLSVRIDDCERIDRMITIAEARRDAVLREIGHRRAAFREALRRASEDAADEAIEAEFEDVAPRATVRGA